MIAVAKESDEFPGCYDTIGPDKVYNFVHMPKCAGTYIEKFIQQNLKTGWLAALNPLPHASIDSTSGYAVKYHYQMPFLDGASEAGKVAQGKPVALIRCVLVRNPIEWYDSYYYYKKEYSDRKNFSEQRLEPIYCGFDSYEETLENSFRESWIKYISFSCLQGGFNPSAWMRAFDIGFYSAWFLYLTTDHAEIFKREGNKNLEDFKQYFHHDTNVATLSKELNLDNLLKGNFPFIKKEATAVKRQRVTSYPENYISCRDILSQNDDLREKFIYKERYVLSLFPDLEI